uniref:Uncharacterized protein n=1 Tax=Panagrolaimus sp. JU765 TaxID=591449 RepID=A0AC34QIT1_9BILA
HKYYCNIQEKAKTYSKSLPFKTNKAGRN